MGPAFQEIAPSPAIIGPTNRQLEQLICLYGVIHLRPNIGLGRAGGQLSHAGRIGEPSQISLGGRCMRGPLLEVAPEDRVPLKVLTGHFLDVVPGSRLDVLLGRSEGKPAGLDVHFEKVGRARHAVGLAGFVCDRQPHFRPAEPEVFATLDQAGAFWNQLFVLIRTDSEPASYLTAVRQAVQSLDPNQPVYLVQTLQDAYARSYAQRTIAAMMLTLFAALALSLAALGIYAVVSYAAAERTREIGVRIALGASGAGVRRLVVAQALVPVLFGAAFGLVFSLGLARLLRGLLYQVGATDPLTLTGVTAILLCVALTASYVPAWRASRLDPLEALRSE